MRQESVTLCSIHHPGSTINTCLQSRHGLNVKDFCQVLGCKLSQQHAGRCKPCYGPEVYVSRILVVLTGQEWTLVTAPLRSSASAYMSTASATLAITLLFKLPVHVLFGTGSLLGSHTGCNNAPGELRFAGCCTGTSQILTNQKQ